MELKVFFAAPHVRIEAVNGRWPLSGHKAEPHQKFATVASSPISCISLHSHIIILDIVEEIYNRDPSLCIHFKKITFISMCCLQRCEEHYLNPGGYEY